MPSTTEAADLFSSVSNAIRRLLGPGQPEVTQAIDCFPTEDHRTRLEYWWDRARPPLIVIGQNPSRATRHRADATVTRCARRAHSMGLGGLVMTNLFSVVATDPKDMWAKPTDQRRQAENIAAIARALDQHPDAPILFAPGGDREPRHAMASRDVEALALARGRRMLCLGVTATGAPRHPSRSAYATKATPWRDRSTAKAR